ncbi:unnamed protein product [Durusdinium trenchii]|uniref:ATP-dependent helicase HrpB n=1 Tax=Durusdinium trenchii TaxID=1381693 RepID=A0ABP0IEF0_9DINO
MEIWGSASSHIGGCEGVSHAAKGQPRTRQPLHPFGQRGFTRGFSLLGFIHGARFSQRRVRQKALPVEEILEDVKQALREPPHAAVIVAPPGAGKTTAVPLALLEDLSGGMVVTEPRRMAARAAARRMATLLGESVGETVGYRTRYEKCVSSRTRIEVVTDGILARRLQADGALPKTSAVLFDEFHERSLGNDIAFTLILHAQEARRHKGLPDLRLVAMSATLSDRLASRLSGLLGGARVVRSEGREYHVQLRHASDSRSLLRATKGFETKAELAKKVCVAATEALQWRASSNEEPGDVLCFLPGEPEIRRCQKLLEEQFSRLSRKVAKPRPTRGFGEAPASAAASQPIDVLPLHGSLDAEAQDLAVQPGEPGRRRVILATNVAEASITVSGVTSVVDSGLRKRSIFNSTTGFNRLELAAVSAASADQRRGRAGRVRDGLCLRLWAKGQKLVPEDVPAIGEEDLTGAILQLLSTGVPLQGISELPWLDCPPKASVNHAEEVLTLLGALEGQELTAHGRQMARLPLHPRLAHLVLCAETKEAGSGPSIASLCALLEDAQRRVGACADVATRLLVLNGEEIPKRYKDISESRKPCARVWQNAQRLVTDLPSAALPLKSCGPLVALAYPERVARRGKNGRFVLRDGSRCSVKDPLLQEQEFLAVARVFKHVVTMAAPLSTAEAVHLLGDG